MENIKYISPELEINEFDTEDVITTSPAVIKTGGSDGRNDF